MRVAIVGSRSIKDQSKVYKIISDWMQGRVSNTPVLISGGATGVDSMVKEYAKEHGFDFILFEPYHMLDKRADFKPAYFFARNRQIVKNADIILAIWDGESKGTEHTIKFAQSLGKPVSVVKVIS